MPVYVNHDMIGQFNVAHLMNYVPFYVIYQVINCCTVFQSIKCDVFGLRNNGGNPASRPTGAVVMSPEIFGA